MVRRGCSWLLALAILGTVGCGGTGTVSGKVTLKDAPLSAGRVVFQQGGKAVATAYISTDGTYKAESVPTGAVNVAVESIGGDSDVGQNVKGAAMMKGSMKKTVGKDKSADGDGGGAVGTKKLAIDAKYKDPEKSDLKLEVKTGANTFDIPLK